MLIDHSGITNSFMFLWQSVFLLVYKFFMYNVLKLKSPFKMFCFFSIFCLYSNWTFVPNLDYNLFKSLTCFHFYNHKMLSHISKRERERERERERYRLVGFAWCIFSTVWKYYTFSIRFIRIQGEVIVYIAY